jgi:hypothetical protein
MVRKWTILGAVFLSGLAGNCQAEDKNLWKREILKNNFSILNGQLSDSSIELGFSITNLCHINTHGGTSNHVSNGSHSGSYNLELWANLPKVIGFETGIFYILSEDGCLGVKGISANSLRSAFKKNIDTIDNCNILVSFL